MTDKLFAELISITPLTANTVCVTVAPQSPFKYRAGQYVELVQPNGEHRPYSIGNAKNEENTLEFHIRHSTPDPFPDDLLAAIQKNKSVEFTGPYGHCVLPTHLPDSIIFICGGTGFAPHKALIEECLTHVKIPNIHLCWSVKSENDLYQLALIHYWQAHFPSIKFTAIFTGLTGKQDFSALLKDAPDLHQAHVYLAGPFTMLSTAKSALQQLGLPDNQCYSDM